MKDEVDFLPAGKQFLQSDTIILDVCGQTCPNYPKYQVCYFSMKFCNFLHIDKHANSPQLDAIILMGMIKHSQSFQNRKIATTLYILHYPKKS